MIDVYDNLINSDLSNHIERDILCDEFPFFYRGVTVDESHYDSLKHKENIKDGPQLTHNFYNHGVYSNCFDIIKPLINEMATILECQVLDLIRVKANLKFNNNNLNENYHNTPHIDSEQDHYAALYFVNDTDGDMFYFNNTSEQKVIKRVSPKKGRFVVFKGNINHGGQHPIVNKVRCTINFNFKNYHK